MEAEYERYIEVCTMKIPEHMSKFAYLQVSGILSIISLII